MTKLLTTKEVAYLLGVTTKTVWGWEKEGKLKAIKTFGGHRRFNGDELLKLIKTERLTVGYVRVGSETQQKQLQEQLAILQAYCTQTDGKWEIIKDIGSGANYGNHGLLRLLDLLCHHRLERIVIPHKSSLPRLGSDLIFELCEMFQVQVVILNNLKTTDSETEWQQDAEEILAQLKAQLNLIHQQYDEELKQQLQGVIAKLRGK